MVIAPRPMRETSRVPRCAVFTVPSFVVEVASGELMAVVVEIKKEIQAFLTSRRAAITPEQAGVPSYGARRVSGLRREEVAVLAGVSIQYYTRLERGDLSGASEGVLEALAGALKLNEAERAHLFEIQWTDDAIT